VELREFYVIVTLRTKSVLTNIFAVHLWVFGFVGIRESCPFPLTWPAFIYTVVHNCEPHDD